MGVHRGGFQGCPAGPSRYESLVGVRHQQGVALKESVCACGDAATRSRPSPRNCCQMRFLRSAIIRRSLRTVRRQVELHTSTSDSVDSADTGQSEIRSVVRSRLELASTGTYPSCGGSQPLSRAEAKDRRAEADDRNRLGSNVFLRMGERPATEVICGFIAEYRARFAVEPICRAIPCSSSAPTPGVSGVEMLDQQMRRLRGISDPASSRTAGP